MCVCVRRCVRACVSACVCVHELSFCLVSLRVLYFVGVCVCRCMAG